MGNSFLRSAGPFRRKLRMGQARCRSISEGFGLALHAAGASRTLQNGPALCRSISEGFRLALHAAGAFRRLRIGLARCRSISEGFGLALRSAGAFRRLRVGPAPCMSFPGGAGFPAWKQTVPDFPSGKSGTVLLNANRASEEDLAAVADVDIVLLRHTDGAALQVVPHVGTALCGLRTDGIDAHGCLEAHLLAPL